MKVRPDKPTTIDTARVSADLAVADKRLAQLEKIDARFAGGQVYDRRRMVIECRSLVVATGEALLELGKRLILLKEHEPHGDWLDCLREIGIEHTFATRAMKAALKFASPNVATSQHLPALGQSKLIELLVLDDDQVEALQEGGTVAGLSLDDVDRMAVSELRAKLRKAREEHVKEKDVHDRLIQQKNTKIDELDAKLARRDAASESERDQALVNELWLAANDVASKQIPLLKILRAMEESCDGRAMPESMDLARRQSLSYLMQLLVELAQQFSVEVDLQQQVFPPWMERFHAEVEQEVGTRQ